MKRSRQAPLQIFLGCLTTLALGHAAFASLGAPQEPVAGPLEGVRSAYRDKRDEDALVQADQALLEITRSGDAGMLAPELYFWRGASLRRLNRPKEALVALEESRVRGFKHPELHLELALVRRSLGQSEAAERDLGEAQAAVPGDLGRQSQLISRWNREGKEDPRFRLTLSPQIGWDSNIIGLDPDSPLVQGSVEEDSFFAGAYLGAKYFVHRDGHQVIELELQSVGRLYTEADELNFWDTLLSAVGRQPLGDWVDLEARVSLGESVIRDSGHFRTERIAGLGLLMTPLHELKLRVFVDWTNADYYDSAPAPQDRDGDIVRGGLEGAIELGRGWTVSPYVTVSKYNTEGSDFDALGVEGGFTIRPEEWMGCRVSLALGLGSQEFENENSLSNFTKKRSDFHVQGTLSIAFRQLERLLGVIPTLSVTYVHHDSNISAYRYERWIPQVDLGINVLSF